jgi:hypothetical protein
MTDRLDQDAAVTDLASGPPLFLTGKLRLEGDVMLASRLTGFFRIPTAG